MRVLGISWNLADKQQKELTLAKEIASHPMMLGMEAIISAYDPKNAD